MGESTAKTAGTPQGRTAAAPGSTGSTTLDGARDADRAQPRRTLLLGRLRAPRRPRLWFEILLIGISYWIYSLIRNAVPEQRSVALRHADWVWSVEHHLGLAVEHGVNHAVNSVTWLIVGMNYYYATLHFIITIGVLVWLYRRHPERYGPARSVLFLTTLLALIGFWAFPLAPPRLMPGKGFIDTVAVHHTWGSLSQGSLSHVSNQYAAMPSMHIGWSLWCGITVVTLARPLWARIMGALYPLFTLSVIISTGNHFWLDAVGGALFLAVGYALVSWLYGRWVYRLPRVAPHL
ncbi:phosphatase PAP2 family protein [Streptomyces sp. NPDC020917]|uniref:phosphatase PAP2 family protein n=1 Tax=Streptomyces sp. NPDC020917 TaxID=3365102 RepID=UPI003789DC17